jgi:phospholipid/cholesterol/gamma-HCH transport system substrate-binding protein
VKHAIRQYLPTSLALLGMVALALGVAIYVLRHQGVRLPVIDEKPLRIEAELSTAQAVSPGQGEIVTVAGVKVGKIAGVRVVDGRARVAIDIDPSYKTLVHQNATALLRPRTVLKDMFLELDPGKAPAPVVHDGDVIPIDNTAADVNTDEILASLDGDTRDYLRLLLNGAGVGLDARGTELQDIFFRFKPTHRDLARVTTALRDRRAALRDLVSSLADLSHELARQPDALTKLVGASANVFDATASQSTGIRSAVHQLPATLTTTRTALGHTGELADALGPTATRLRPTVKSLGEANAALKPLAAVATPLVRDHVRPGVQKLRPLVRNLRPAARATAEASPELTRSLNVVNHLLNMLGYNPAPNAGPFDGKGTRGYLFWIAWGAHAATSIYSTQDAHNIYRSVAVGMACDTVRESIQQEPALEFINNLTAILYSPLGCKDH